MDSSEDLRKLRLLLDSLPSKVRSGKGFSGGGGADDTGSVKPQGPVWIGRHFRLDRTNQGAFTGQPGRRQQQRPAAAPLAPRSLAHRAAWREASEPSDAVVPAGVCGAYLSCSALGAITTPIVKPSCLVINRLHFPVPDPGTGSCQQLSAVCSSYQHLPANPLLSSGIQCSFCIP